MAVSANNEFTHTIAPRTSGPEAAVLAVLNKSGKILLVEEGEADPKSGKKVGDWSLISETCEAGEGVKGNALRAIKEELGEEAEIMDNLYLIPGSHREANYAFDSSTGHSRIFLLRFKGDQGLPFHAKNPKEITGYRWAGLDEIRQLNSDHKLAPSAFDDINQLNEQGLIKPYTEDERLEKIRLPVAKETELISKA